MDVSKTRIGFLCLCALLVCAIAGREASAQLSGLYQSAPGTTGVYNYQYDNLHSVTLPVNLTVSFSGDNPTTSLSATIVAPIIGLALSPLAAIIVYAIMLAGIFVYVLRFGHFDVAFLRTLSWPITWSLLALFFAFCVHQLVLYQ